MDLDWEEGVFRGLLTLRRRLRGSPPDPDPGAVALADHEVALTTLARLVAGRPVRVLPARDVGGVRGTDLLLPERIGVAPEASTNRALYGVRTAISAAVCRLFVGRPTGETRGDDLVTTLERTGVALDWLADEFPRFARDWQHLRHWALVGRPDPSELRGRERIAEELRRAALAGERPWEDPERRRAFEAARIRRGPGSPPLLLFGEWIPDLAAAERSDLAADEPTPAEITSETEAPAVEEVRRVEIDPKEREDAVLIHVFEKTETLDEYRGGARDLDGSDQLDDQLDALREVDLGALVRDGTETRAGLKADLPLGADIPDAADGGELPRGIPYDEWDVRRRRYRPDWCTVYPSRAAGGSDGGAAWASAALRRHRRLQRELRRRLESQRAGLRPVPRQLDGDDVDIDAMIDHHVSLRAGYGEDPRLYIKTHKRRRDFVTTVLLDVSLSTDSWYEGRRVLDVSREAVLLLGEVADQLGDRLQVLAFASKTRNRCHVWHLKDWSDPWSPARAAIGALEPQGYTRIGPALRYACDGLAREPAERRLLLLISDGKPTDVDRYEGRYGIADVRQALREAERREIHTHALAVDARARDHLSPMFGPGAWHVLSHPEALPSALATVYGRLTAR